MKRTFIESSAFSRAIDAKSPGTLLQIQTELLRNPGGGSVIQRTGGLRKMRVPDADRRKGKRGGYRVIYLDLPDAERTHLLAIYDKGEKDDISTEEKRLLRAIAERIKREAR